MVKCPCCNKELKVLEGTHKIVVQLADASSTKVAPNQITMFCSVCNHEFTINDDWTYNGSECEHHNSSKDAKDSQYVKDQKCTACGEPDEFSDETLCHACIEKWKGVLYERAFNDGYNKCFQDAKNTKEVIKK